MVKASAMWKSPTGFAAGIAMAAVLLAAGCASFPPPKETIPGSRTYGYAYNDVWESVLATLSDLSIPVKTMEKEAGHVVAEDNTIELRQYELGRYDSRYCFCGSPDQHHFFRELVGEYTISISRETDTRTSVAIDTSFRASQYSGERFTGRSPCLSKGIFEPMFLERLDDQLAARRGRTRDFRWWKPSRGY